MPTVNELNPKIDQTVTIFDSFYNYTANIPSMEYDVVLSYFRSVFTTKLAAENFTNALFRVADETKVNALDLLATFQAQGNNQLNLTVTMCYYLNSVRSPATLLGVLNPTTPNFYTARNIKQ